MKIETVIIVGSITSAVNPAIPAAVGANSSPITATIAPMAAGGKTISSHFVPIALILKATKEKIAPTTIKPPRAAS